ncbi:MAG: phage tail tape measure protein [Natronosporangium sp.]
MASRNLYVNIIGVDKASAKFGTVGKAVGLLAGPALAAGTALFAMGQQFDNARDAIITGTGASGKALKGLQADFRAVASTTAASFGDVGQAIAAVNTRLGLTGRPLQDVSRKILNLSRITKTDLNENIESITRLFGDWSVKTKDQSKTLDKLFKVSQATGVGVSDLSRLMVQFGSPLRQLGLDFDFSAAMFARFEKEGVNIQTAMPGLRMALKNFAKEGREPADALMETFRAIKTASSTAKANTLAFEVFGVRAGPDLAAAIREGRFDLNELIGTMRDSKGALDDASKRTEDFGEKWLKLKNKVFLKLEGPATAVFDGISAGMDRLLAAVEPFAQFVSSRVIPALKGIFGWMRRNEGLMKTLAVTIGVLVIVTKAHAAALKVQAAGGVLAFMTSYLKSIKIVQVATKAWAAVQWLLNAAMAANPITLIILALVALGVALFILWNKSATFRDIVIGTWNALLAAGKIVVGFLVRLWRDTLAPIFAWLYNTIIRPYIGFVIATFKVWWFFANLVVMGIRKLIEKVIAPVVVWLYKNIVRPYIGLIIVMVKMWARIFQWLWRNVIKPVWNSIAAAIKFGWRNVIQPVFNAIISVVRDKLAPAFRKGVDFIAKAWERLKNAAKKPVNFVIGTVVNKGIIGTLNRLAKLLGVKQRLGTVPLLAAGGAMPVRPGMFNRPTAIVGEGNRSHPEFVIPTDPKHRDRALALWEQAGGQLMAGGGILGLLSGPAGWLKDKLAGPVGAIKEKFGDNAFVKLLTAVPAKILDWAIGWAKNLIGSGGGKFLGKSGDSSVGAIAAVARRFHSGARVSSGHRPGDPGYHGRGLAADLVGGGAKDMARIAAGFYRMSGRLIELIHSGGGGYFVKNGHRVGPGYYRSVLGEHYNHVHVAARRDALLGSYRHGSSYVPRDGLAYLHQGERVVSAEGNRAGRPVYNVTVQAWSDRFSLRQVQDEFAFHGAT